eukprot:6176590-Pleurochrysis_carterae.AAC.2
MRDHPRVPAKASAVWGCSARYKERQRTCNEHITLLTSEKRTVPKEPRVRDRNRRITQRIRDRRANATIQCRSVASSQAF